MGYRSDVRLRTTKEGYEIMKAEIDKYLEEKKKTGDRDFDYEPENLLKTANNTEIENNGNIDIVTVDWTYMKWYDYYVEVMAFDHALHILADKDIDYQYMRMGEELDDIEEKWSINNDSFDSFYVSRNFEG